MSDTGNTYLYNLNKRKTVQTVSSGFIEAIADTKGEAYLTYFVNFDTFNNDQVKENLKKMSSNFQEYEIDGYVDPVNAIKLDIGNILSVYCVSYSMKSSDYFVFIYDNGKVAYINESEILDTGNVNLQKIDDIEGIISVADNINGHTPYLLDINGNEYMLDSYFQ